jgi:hypothetical protein
MPDGIQYFEVPVGEGRKVLFVRIGQDEPLFDEQTLRVLPGPEPDPDRVEAASMPLHIQLG